MLPKLGNWLLLVSLALPALASQRSGSISGYVRSSNGVPQMGAVVEILGATAQGLRVFTDTNGFYSAAGLLPGNYSLKVSAPSFLPALRESIGLHSGSMLMLNIKLSTLFEAIQLAPTSGQPDDDWKWVLRSAARRPVLRILPDGTPVVISNPESDREVKGSLSFLAGTSSPGLANASVVSTGFAMEKSVSSTGSLALSGNVGGGDASPLTVLRAAYRHELPNGSAPQIAITMRRFVSPDISLHGAALESLSFSSSDNLTVGDFIELKFGSEFQAIQFLGRASAFRPFGSADLHLSPNTIVEYSYTTSRPVNRMIADRLPSDSAVGFDSAPADLIESGPQLSIVNNSVRVEKDNHQELSLSRRIHNTNLQLASYVDRVSDPALLGVGDAVSETAGILPNIYSGTYAYRGKNLQTAGLRVVAQRKLTSDLTATMDYAYGGVLDFEGNALLPIADARSSMTTRERHTLAAKVAGTLPSAKTQWSASYRWISGRALTPVDMFNGSHGQADPYLNLCLRQPLPNIGGFAGHMEALLEVRNLLAQGYVPVLGGDGHTLYMVQSARALRAGLAFTF